MPLNPLLANIKKQLDSGRYKLEDIAKSNNITKEEILKTFSTYIRKNNINIQ